MADLAALANAYLAGFKAGDHQAILACLTDDVIWDLPGYRRLEGKVAFDGEIESEGFVGRPDLHLDRMIEGQDSVVLIGTGEGGLSAGGSFRFAFCTVLTFRADLISRVDSYIVPLT